MALLGVVLGLVLLCDSIGRLQAAGHDLDRGCTLPCPNGEHCELEHVDHGGYYSTRSQVCVGDPLPVERPSSCQNVHCGDLQTCVLQEVICIRAPCYPVPACIPDRCAAVRCGTGTVCVTARRSDSQPACSDFPNCQFTVRCEPRAKPKPGFCPPPEQVSQANVSRCEYDNDCASGLLCCPGASGGGRGCTSPAYPHPCYDFECPPEAPTCVVRGGMQTCLDRVCQPGSFFCRDDKQFFCSDEGEIIDTGVPAPADCS
ncbi:prespore protein Dp87-like [Pollicipes pollicipes]|uniref:prespore protein Dp87-like n=1 Tax=Pollicipes pollicipes TaxID=41117 RepID=UPI001884C38D|nr:prespore protein Dp87-like [Pollicipes pollicipes]